VRHVPTSARTALHQKDEKLEWCGRPSEVSRPGTIVAGRSRARGRSHCESPPIHARPSFGTGRGRPDA
jgi:hypothetical protein